MASGVPRPASAQRVSEAGLGGSRGVCRGPRPHTWSKSSKSLALGWWMVQTMERPPWARPFIRDTTWKQDALSRPLQVKGTVRRDVARGGGSPLPFQPTAPWGQRTPGAQDPSTAWAGTRGWGAGLSPLGHLDELEVDRDLPMVPVYLVGSSKNMTGGLLTSSSAMARRFRWPPDRLPVRVLAQDSRPSAVRISFTWGQGTGFL